ncbi:ABC transporter permease [Thermoanaerobacter siderophilus]|uniref:Putative ABC-type transport system, permease component n=1 Tax=Thermoanaerobacter siderophilus SR4 TaxID=880478 RepID=I8R214_9THEO|nr:ABC transporter permease [Thermoanaerobacter siderophilus]EIV99399.1 putative ABC-type transport system, permease component [Thermoanaerobacter siderophilus SR4]
MNIIEIIFSANFVYAILRVTTPILFAALGAIVSDRAGVINIALEGTMLAAALSGVIISALTHSAWLGLLAALITGVMMSILLAYFSINLKTDIVLAGIALNLLASGGTIFVLYLVAHDKGISSSLKSEVLPKVTIPLIEKIPFLGSILSGHNILTYVALGTVFLVYILLYKTPLGLRIRAVGENADAADSVGVGVNKVRYIALILSGLLASFGGAYMSMGYVSWFSTNMTAGRGFIALAAEAMGKGTPIGTFLASLLFGFAGALASNLQSFRIPSEFVQMIPYIVTIIGLVIYSSSQANKIIKK